jgi:tRNA (guanine37-N1)-methyltransferase
MRIDIITVFPKILIDPLNESILKQARQRTDIAINIFNLRDFSDDKHHTVDDIPYGGGPGMILKPEPLFSVLEHIFQLKGDNERARVIFPSPQGKIFSQHLAHGLSLCPHLVFICGHYKAVDQRVIDYWVTDEISVGDFILSGGEIPTLLIIDALVRLLPGVLGNIESARSDSFQDYLLDCPYYTRPENFKGLKVPQILLSGNHQAIREWKLNQKVKNTLERRPDLYQKYIKNSSRENENRRRT